MEEIVFRPIYLPYNRGLGNALRVALNNSTFDLVARMDSDDISINRRFEFQLEYLSDYPDTDVVGGNITEFVGDASNIVFERNVPCQDSSIKKEMKHRCAMNHVSVMYKKESVQLAGGYLDWYMNEDYYLWIRMLEKGCTFGNVAHSLVNVRIGADMSARRGGWKYFRSEQSLQNYMLQHHLIALPRYVFNIAFRFGGEVLASNSFRSKLFHFMRKKYDVKASIQNSRVNCSDKTESGSRKKYPPFSVAMSVYGKDNAEWFDVALASIINQTVKPAEIVLVVDGPIPDAIHQVINKYETLCTSLAGGGRISGYIHSDKSRSR